MLISFELSINFSFSMPVPDSWTGRWPGENYYAKAVNLGGSRESIKKAKAILDKGYYCYNFGDGWAVVIKVKKVSSKEAAKIRRKSNGFSGYDWMVQSILVNNKIVSMEHSCD